MTTDDERPDARFDLGRWAWQAAALVWGFAEATLFFIVPDVLLSAIAVRRGLRDGLTACLCAAIGASLGGALMYLWSARDLAGAQAAVLAMPAVNEAMLDTAWRAMASQGWFAATFAGPLTATPFKVYAILAPHIGAGFNAFAFATIVARLPRFLIVTFGAGILARLLEAYIAKRWIMAGLGSAWLVFYALFFAFLPG